MNKVVELRNTGKTLDGTNPGVQLSKKVRPYYGPERRCSRSDRRSPGDRRTTYSLDYFLNGGRERRKGGERRSVAERRAGWVKI
jgi:hypothetical protein